MPPSKLTVSFAIIAILNLCGSACCEEHLKDFAPTGFYVGGVLHGDSDGFNSAEYRNVAATEFNAITATIYMGWGPWPEPQRQPDVQRITTVTDWAEKQSLKVHGHALLYPMSNESLPWYQNLPDNLVGVHLERFIHAVAGKHAGRIWVWDVVNEVMADSGEQADALGLRTKYKEYRAMGPGYVEFAFRAARRADPDALLIINDYGIEEWNTKSTRLLEFAKQLKAKGVPIDGVGFQSHFTDLRQASLNSDSVRKNFQRFADAGFQLFITEMDVCSIATKRPHPGNPGVSTPNDQQRLRQASFYRDMMKIALEQPACKALLLWDYADDFSWLHKTDRWIDKLSPGTYTHPTPFWCGKHCPIQRKDAYYAMLEVLKTTPAPDRD
jgi:endo-1,4-beta-xylanase